MNEKEQIKNFFEEYVFGFMCNDLESAINQGCNFLCALGLVVYTEIMGSLVTGTLGQAGHGGSNFSKFLEYMGEKYIQLDKTQDLYKRVRCGLVHEYFVKGPSTISMDVLPALETGIRIDKETDVTYFYVPTYFKNFKEGVERYLKDLLENDDTDLRKNFFIAIERKISDIEKLDLMGKAVSGDFVWSVFKPD